jgi:hypothetical protein
MPWLPGVVPPLLEPGPCGRPLIPVEWTKGAGGAAVRSGALVAKGGTGGPRGLRGVAEPPPLKPTGSNPPTSSSPTSPGTKPKGVLVRPKADAVAEAGDSMPATAAGSREWPG